jgi:hypothetical protein
VRTASQPSSVRGASIRILALSITFALHLAHLHACWGNLAERHIRRDGYFIVQPAELRWFDLQFSKVRDGSGQKIWRCHLGFVARVESCDFELEFARFFK